MTKPGQKVRPVPGMAESRDEGKKEGHVKPPNVAAYIRVSSRRQVVEGYSLEDQEKSLKKFCKDRKLIIIKYFVEEGVSGGTDNRREFQKMIKFCMKNHAEVSEIVIYDVKRYFREAYLHLKYRRELCDVGIGFLSPNYDFKFEPDADEVKAAANAQGEREDIIKRAKEAASTARGRGKFVGRVPIGFMYERDLSRSRGMIVIHDPVAAPIIAEAFRMYAYSDRKISDIKKWADNNGLVNHKSGRKISNSSFYRIFSNPVYAGIYYDKHTGFYQLEFDGIIPRKLFDASYARMMSGKRSSSTSNERAHEFPLKGVILCPRCEKRLTGSSPMGKKKRYHYYHLSRHNPSCSDPSIHIPSEKADLAFVDILKRISPEEPLYDLMERCALDWQEDKRDKIRTELKSLEDERKSLQQTLDGLIEKFALDKLGDEEFARVKGNINDKIAVIDKEVEEIGSRDIPMKNFVQRSVWALDHLDLSWTMADNDARLKLAKSLFPKGFKCDKAGNIELLSKVILQDLLSIK